ncbi:hypothetical protein ACP70R_021171 [Stipagrostis hirtigluma subsp. patula]
MATMSTRLALVLIFSCCCLTTPSSSSASSDGFLHCLCERIPDELVFTQGSRNFSDVLLSSVQELRFATNATVRPLCVVTATDACHVQAAVRCGRAHGVRLRVRSGGHDYEGLSYRSLRPEVFAVVDLANLRAVAVSAGEWPEPTAWVESGATLGELYYAVGKSSPELGFPAGVCPTIGVGGHLSGGGIGMMMRRFGLSIDRVVDARLVTADGDLVDRAAMGEDLFWALRGGGGGSFGVVVSWKVTLVRVPPTVTVVNTVKTVEQDGGAIDALTKWQHVAPSLPSDINLRAMLVPGRPAIAVFQSLYLGPCADLLPTMSLRFPELNVTAADCREMSWLKSMAFVNLSDPDTPVEELLNRRQNLSSFSKKKSDYVRRAIPRGAWRKIAPWLTADGAGVLVMEPHGGYIGTIPAGATPYSHRSGVLYNIQYVATWSDGGGGGDSAAARWVNDLYSFMEPYVTRSPREAYVNYRDLDLGENEVVNDVSTFESGKVWGEKYFGAANFERLAKVKAAVDPTDYFRNEQSIPPLFRSY